MLRFSVLLVSAYLVSNSAFADRCLRSALVRGTAYNVRSCTYSIKFSYFADGILCPVGERVARTITVDDSAHCRVAEGQEVEGVLQESAQGWTLED